jgi:transcriptional antiterminator RfaH
MNTALWQETNWFAVQSKPHRESLAAASVAKLEVEVFLPKIRQEQLVCGFERVVVKPLFPGYFFAKFSPVMLLETVRYARGVLRVIGSALFPVPMEKEIISAIQDRVEEDGFVQLEATAFQPGDRVTIEQGPLAGWMGKVEREWDDRKRVMILLDAIEQARALVEKRWLTATAA